ncbi:hypothetical protein PoB_003570200 [Plakobranchus ocellatus]|uniref:Uncharacterized protein n=1 Tax=Plakobranchus ocellatus TaxID=259542 RepID=A0AAV4AQI4_9GAST|nr:hypothetical protein PoB_003570200 [Plakobranchus ocellatus]
MAGIVGKDARQETDSDLEMARGVGTHAVGIGLKEGESSADGSDGTDGMKRLGDGNIVSREPSLRFSSDLSVSVTSSSTSLPVEGLKA